MSTELQIADNMLPLIYRIILNVLHFSC